MKFSLSTKTATLAQALQAADEIECAIGEIANRQRKPGNFPVEPIARLVQFARNQKQRKSS